MKARTINLILCNKFDRWIETIEDVAVRELAKQHAICTGGAIASMLLGEDAKDFDFYFRDKATTAAVARYYVKKFSENPTAKFKSQYIGKRVALSVQELDDRVRVFIKSAGVMSEEGGSTVNYRYFEGLNPNDPNLDRYIQELAEEHVEEAETEQKEKKDRPKYRPVFLTANAITLSDQVQIVTRFFGEPAQIHENYDFVHCTNYWTSWERKVHLNGDAMECLLAKELRYVGSRYPICSMFRLRKFIGRGWTITAGQMMKIAMQINDLDLTDMEVLEEQLTGVDASYFRQLIDALRERDPKRVDAAYLMQLLDRVL